MCWRLFPYFHRSEDQSLVQICNYILELGKHDINPGVRDRARYESAVVQLVKDSPERLSWYVKQSSWPSAGATFYPLPPWADRNTPSSRRDPSSQSSASKTLPSSANASSQVAPVSFYNESSSDGSDNSASDIVSSSDSEDSSETDLNKSIAATNLMDPTKDEDDHLDEDHRLLLRSSISLLKSRNYPITTAIWVVSELYLISERPIFVTPELSDSKVREGVFYITAKN